MKKLVCSIGVILMTLASCTFKKSETNSSSENSLNIHFPAVDLILDPQKMEDMFSMVVNVQLHRGLLRYAPNGDILPDLASTWSESADHRTYTFKLRDAQFSNGTKIEALNVKMSFARLFSTGAAMGADIDYIEGANEFRATGDIAKLGIELRSSDVIEFKLKHPSSLFLKHLAVTDCAILSIKHLSDPISFNSTTGYSGPYKVRALGPNGVVIIEKWREDHLQSKNPPKTIRFFPTSEAPEILAATNKTDCLDHDIVSNNVRDRLVKQRWSEVPTELIGETYVIMNPSKVPENIRAAMAAAISPSEASQILGAKYVPAFGAIPRGVQGEMRESDYPKQNKLPAKGTIHLEFDPKNPVHAKLEAFLKSKWENIGLTVKPMPLEKKELLGRVFGSKCEVCIGQKGLDYPDGFSVLTYFKSEYPSNYFHVRNKRIDAMVDAAGRILDKAQRESKYREIQKAILLEHTLIPLAFGSEASGLWSPKVKSVPPHIIGFHMMPFEAVEMAQ